MNDSNDFRQNLNCEEFEAALFDAGPTLDAARVLRSDLREHALFCARCSDLLAEMRELNLVLSKLAEADACEGMPCSAEAALLQDFRRQRGPQRGEREFLQAWAFASAAVVLLILGIAVHRPVAPTYKEAVNPESVPPEHVNARAISDTKNAEVATTNADSFLALSYSDDEANPEDGAIIRVLVPRSTLASMGIPVADISEERVPAEVVMGEDGTPQAIRLVSQDREEEF
jgi:hypothetical protein